MDFIKLLRNELSVAHNWLEETVADVTDDMAHALPGGSAHPIGSRYAHVVVAEDHQINSFLQGKPALYEAQFAATAGLENPGAAFWVTREWATSIKVDMTQLRQYAQAVYRQSDEYLRTLTDADLARIVELPEGLPQVTVAEFMLRFMYGHIRDLMGEISAIKGVLGAARGYPM